MEQIKEFIDEHRNAAILQILDKEIKGELPPSKKLLYEELSKIQPNYKYNLMENYVVKDSRTDQEWSRYETEEEAADVVAELNAHEEDDYFFYYYI